MKWLNRTMADLNAASIPTVCTYMRASVCVCMCIHTKSSHRISSLWWRIISCSHHTVEILLCAPETVCPLTFPRILPPSLSPSLSSTHLASLLFLLLLLFVDTAGDWTYASCLGGKHALTLNYTTLSLLLKSGLLSFRSHLECTCVCSCVEAQR